MQLIDFLCAPLRPWRLSRNKTLAAREHPHPNPLQGPPGASSWPLAGEGPGIAPSPPSGRGGRALLPLPRAGEGGGEGGGATIAICFSTNAGRQSGSGMLSRSKIMAVRGHPHPNPLQGPLGASSWPLAGKGADMLPLPFPPASGRRGGALLPLPHAGEGWGEGSRTTNTVVSPRTPGADKPLGRSRATT